MTKKGNGEDISGTYVVVKVEGDKLEQISLPLDSYEDAESFKETMLDGYLYKGKILKTVKIL